jgi:hypothetical protein
MGKRSYPGQSKYYPGQFKIMQKRRRLLISGVAGLAACALVYVLTGRLKYYDYETTACHADTVQLSANFVGSFGKDHPTERRSPYFLRLAVSPYSTGLIINNLKLKSLESTQSYDLHVTAEESTPQSAFIVQSITVPFEDYELSGHLVLTQHASNEVDFSCKLKRRFHTKIRIPLWDAFMSV